LDDRLRSSIAKLALAGVVMGAALVVSSGPVMALCESLGASRFAVALAILGALSGAVYGGAVIAMLGPRWFRAFRHTYDA
jgi:hypothetical protein